MLFLFSPVKTKAIYEVIDSRCTSDIKILLREKASLVAYKTNKNTTESITYEIQLLNLDDDIYILNQLDNKIYTKQNSIIKNIIPGSTVTLSIYGSNNTYCEGYKVITKTVVIPYHNKYSTNDLCIGYESYALCNEFSNINITEEEFKTRMEIYIASLKTKDKENKEDEKNNNEDVGFNLANFIIEYNLYISAFGLILLVIYITVIINNLSKKKRGIL